MNAVLSNVNEVPSVLSVMRFEPVAGPPTGRIATLWLSMKAVHLPSGDVRGRAVVLASSPRTGPAMPRRISPGRGSSGVWQA